MCTMDHNNRYQWMFSWVGEQNQRLSLGSMNYLNLPILRTKGNHRTDITEYI